MQISVLLDSPWSYTKPTTIEILLVYYTSTLLYYKSYILHKMRRTNKMYIRTRLFCNWWNNFKETSTEKRYYIYMYFGTICSMCILKRKRFTFVLLHRKRWMLCSKILNFQDLNGTASKRSYPVGKKHFRNRDFSLWGNHAATLDSFFFHF